MGMAGVVSMVSVVCMMSVVMRGVMMGMTAMMAAVSFRIHRQGAKQEHASGRQHHRFSIDCEHDSSPC